MICLFSKLNLTCSLNVIILLIIVVRMKQIILLTFFSFFTVALFAQSEKSCIGCGTYFSESSAVAKTAVSVFPNPATEYIAINDESDRVTKVEVYNLTGRQMKSFVAAKGEKYNVFDLADGVYFVRLLDKNNRIVTTQRITKR